MDDPGHSFAVEQLGVCRIASPMSYVQFADDNCQVLVGSGLEEIRPYLDQGRLPPAFEAAGPREKIYFDPATLRCGIVTCGGLCPGLNNVIRAIVLSLFHHYGVQTIYGFRYGYEGLVPHLGHQPLELSPRVVEPIGELGGTILGSSRGPQDISVMVDHLRQMGVGILFAIGGDGTLRGAGAIAAEARRCGLQLAVIGIPKTIDNDISYVQNSFGFHTASSVARDAILAAHSEAEGARNGVGLVKLMGRESGFIAAYAALGSGQVNFCLVPESPLTLGGLLAALRKRLEARGHAVIAVAEGAGQELLQQSLGQDASGNVRFADIGVFLRDRIKEYFAQIGMELNLKYIDPSYTIRSCPANAYDAAFCLLLGQNAVHAGMAGRTNMVVGNWRGEFTHVPIPLATAQRKRIDPKSWLWSSVLAATGQPPELC